MACADVVGPRSVATALQQKPGDDDEEQDAVDHDGTAGFVQHSLLDHAERERGGERLGHALHAPDHRGGERAQQQRRALEAADVHALNRQAQQHAETRTGLRR